MTAGISASQLLFNGSWLVGLQASKAYAELQNKSIRSSEIEIKEDVQQYYHLAAIAKKNVEVLSQTKAVLTQLRDETNLLFKEGFVEEQDVEMLTLSISDLDNRINAATEQEKLTINMLKFVIGMPVTQEVSLSQTADELIGKTALENTPFSAEANINVQIAENALLLQELALKNEKSKLLPNAAAFYNLQTQALRQEFNFFNTSKPWFPIQLWGVQMNIPIFTGGSQAKSIEKAKVEVQRSKDVLNTAKEGAFVAYQSSKISYDFALKNYENAKQSLSLSQRILDKTNTKFKEGLSSSFDVSQSTTQVLQAQGTFIQALLNLLDAETAMKKALNNL
jgi:outer membrane protein TolC